MNSKLAVQRIIKELDGRGGFDDWWGNLGDDIQDEIRDKLEEILTEEHDPVALADDLYTHYCELVGGKAFNGDPLPGWKEFSTDPKKKPQAKGWLGVARRAIERLTK